MHWRRHFVDAFLFSILLKVVRPSLPDMSWHEFSPFQSSRNILLSDDSEFSYIGWRIAAMTSAGLSENVSLGPDRIHQHAVASDSVN